MKTVSKEDIAKLVFSSPESHKGQNGRMLLIGGSHLFHAASLWSLTVASRIVDLVHYASTPENNDIVSRVKEEFRNGVVIARNDIESYIEEDDCILIGPGMVRADKGEGERGKGEAIHFQAIMDMGDEGEQTRALTNYLLKKYPNKQWVIDAGALQMLDISLIPEHAILTPHHGEFEGLWKKYLGTGISYVGNDDLEKKVTAFAKQYNCIVLLKGPVDIASNGVETRLIEGGNVGMTKGGTGDVLAGLIAALACKNDPFLATISGSYINKRAGDDLYTTVGPFFNSTDLANQIPKTMAGLTVSSNQSSVISHK